MQTHSLRHILTRQSILASALPFVLLAMLGMFWLLPQMYADIEARNRELTMSVKAQLNSYLTTARVAVGGSIHTYQHGGEPKHMREVLDAHLKASDNLSALYVADQRGRIRVASVASGVNVVVDELYGLDISGSAIFSQVKRGGRPAWSESFLSIVSRGLSVAYALSSSGMVLIGEIRMQELTRFLQELNVKPEALMLVTDQKGRVIAGNEERFTAQLLDISNIPVIRDGLGSMTPVSSRFEFEGKAMVGSVVTIPATGWGVLVAQPVERAYRTVWISAGIVAVWFVSALLLGIGLALFMSRRMAASFGELTAHARRLLRDRSNGEIPASNISEFQQLAGDLSVMAETLSAHERELVAAKEYSENLIRAANMIIIGLDMEDHVTMMNQEAEKVTGYCLAELYGRNWFELLVPEELFPGIYDEYRCIRGQGSSGVLENPIQTRDGQKRIIFWHNNPIIENGVVVGMVCFGSDVTEQRNMMQQLIQAQKMESVGRLAGGVAHDFNNKLTVILGYAELIKLGVPMESKLWQELNEITKAAEHSREITAQLLAFSRQQVISPKVLNINAVIGDMQKTLPRLIGEDIRIILESGAGLWLTLIDPTQLDQIIMNLAVNARDAMPDGGELTVGTRNVLVDQELCGDNMDARPGEYVLLSVQDTGHGMDQDLVRHVFEPFFTTKQVGKGTGLGLATIFGIVSQNGGFIKVTSTPGVGSIFDVYLPRFTGEVAAESVDGDQRVHGSGTILLVEDDVTVRDMTRAMLVRMGYQVTVADDPQHAIRLCDDDQNRFDLILTDVIMPVMNGREMVDRISESRPDARVLYMSGYASDIIQEKGRVDTDMHFIQKPFDMVSLNQKIKEAML